MMAEATPRTDNPWKQLSIPVQDAGALRQEAIEAHHDHLITEIETSEGPLATTLRWVVYELGSAVSSLLRLLECCTSTSSVFFSPNIYYVLV